MERERETDREAEMQRERERGADREAEMQRIGQTVVLRRRGKSDREDKWRHRESKRQGD